MNTNYSNNIPFKAIKISEPEIVRRTWYGKYVTHKVSCVKIDPLNKNDIRALDTISKNWKECSFTVWIKNIAIAIKNNSQYYRKNEIFALTTQENNFTKLNPENILGVFNVKVLDSKGHAYLEHIETNPLYRTNSHAKYKAIGTGMLDSLKQIYRKISLFSLNKQKVKEFYIRNNFIESPEHSCEFEWVSNNHNTDYK